MIHELTLIKFCSFYVELLTHHVYHVHNLWYTYNLCSEHYVPLLPTLVCYENPNEDLLTEQQTLP